MRLGDSKPQCSGSKNLGNIPGPAFEGIFEASKLVGRGRGLYE